MNAPARPTQRPRRWPWVIWTGVVATLVPTIALSIRNGSLDEDPAFIPIAVMMILGYATTGTILATRTRGNPVAWLLLTVGLLFVLVGFSDEYLQYAEASGRTGSTVVAVVALFSTVVWLPMLGIVSLLVLLFPTGDVPGPRWRVLPWVIVGALVVFVIGTVLEPGPLDPDDTGIPQQIESPAGVEALDAIAPVLVGIASLIGLGSIPFALTALLLRYRRSRGDERQQLRWLAYVVVALIGLVLLQFALSLVPGNPPALALPSTLLFLASFALVGIGVPVAMAIAVLRYRLYDLDVVVKKTVVFAIVAAVFVAIGVAVAVMTGQGIAPSLERDPELMLLLGVAYGVLAIPLYRLSTRIADRIVYGTRATPYEILSEFSGRVGETFSTEDVLPRMAQLLAEATGASASYVWLRVGGTFRAAASWPSDAPTPSSGPTAADELPDLPGHAIEVRHQDELLGALTVEMPPSDPMRPAKERIVRDLAAQAGLVLRNVRLIEELRESRRRIVAAQDDRAKKLERNIHDGAQQQLVALAVKARLAAATATKDPDRTAITLEEIQRDLADALENLRDLARGIYPPLLADQGLGAALTAQARKSPVPVSVDVNGAGRYPPDIEATVYFSVLEALQNVGKYAGATAAHVRLEADGRELRFSVTDDGRGFDAATVSHGSGLQGLADRLSAVGGVFAVTSAPGHGTQVHGRIPIDGA